MDDALDRCQIELAFGQPQDHPSGKCGLKVFLDVGQKPLGSIVPPLEPDTALDFDECAGGQMGEIRTPAPTGKEHQLAFEGGTISRFPE
jgi:hypothetical protein